MLACNDPPPHINLCDLIVAGKPRSHTNTSFLRERGEKNPDAKSEREGGLRLR